MEIQKIFSFHNKKLTPPFFNHLSANCHRSDNLRLQRKIVPLSLKYEIISSCAAHQNKKCNSHTF